METLSERDFDIIPKIRVVQLKNRLESRQPDFRVGLICRPIDEGGFFPFYIDLCDDQEGEVNIEMEPPIPSNQVPRFLIHSDCLKEHFADAHESAETLWPRLASNALTRFRPIKVILERDQGELVATVHIGVFVAEGRIPFEKVRKFFK